jgi:hypothetical protein
MIVEVGMESEQIQQMTGEGGVLDSWFMVVEMRKMSGWESVWIRSVIVDWLSGDEAGTSIGNLDVVDGRDAFEVGEVCLVVVCASIVCTPRVADRKAMKPVCDSEFQNLRLTG